MKVHADEKVYFHYSSTVSIIPVLYKILSEMNESEEYFVQMWRDHSENPSWWVYGPNQQAKDTLSTTINLKLWWIQFVCYILLIVLYKLQKLSWAFDIPIWFYSENKTCSVMIEFSGLNIALSLYIQVITMSNLVYWIAR